MESMFGVERPLSRDFSPLLYNFKDTVMPGDKLEDFCMSSPSTDRNESVRKERTTSGLHSTVSRYQEDESLELRFETVGSESSSAPERSALSEVPDISGEDQEGDSTSDVDTDSLDSRRSTGECTTAPEKPQTAREDPPSPTTYESWLGFRENHNCVRSSKHSHVECAMSEFLADLSRGAIGPLDQSLAGLSLSLQHAIAASERAFDPVVHAAHPSCVERHPYFRRLFHSHLDC